MQAVALQTSLKRYLDWWLGELAMLLPRTFRRRYRHRGCILCIMVEPSRLRISRRDGGRLRALGEIPIEPEGELPADDCERLRTLTDGMRPESTDIEITVAPELTLIKEVDLPPAALVNLHQVLGFEMPRLTPFSADDVYYNHVVTERGDDVLRVRLAVVPRRFVDQATKWLLDWTLRPAPDPSRFRSAPTIDDDETIVLDFRDHRYSVSRRRRIHSALLILNALLVVAVVAIPLVREHQRLDEAEIRLDQAQRAVEETAESRRQIEQSWARATFLAARTNDRVSTVALLEELTVRLPDSTWVFRLELRDGAVQMRGTSATAASLIAALEDSLTLANVRFASPVVRESNTRRDQFHIAADVVPLGARR